MNLKRSLAFLAAFVLTVCGDSFAQGSSSFDVDAYKAFLSTHQNLTPEQLLSLHPAGTFEPSSQTGPDDAAYYANVDSFLALTPCEKGLIAQHGFAVTERVRVNSFGQGFIAVYNRDLPVFISTDAILHALHMSYDTILVEVERGVLIADVDSLLARLRRQVPGLAAKYAAVPGVENPLDDIDLYLTVPRRLLGHADPALFPRNEARIDSMLAFIEAQQVAWYPLFSTTSRAIDFSQFTPRGHYATSEDLRRYFKAMMWLGRTEFYLIAPKNTFPKQTEEDIRRQITGAVFLSEAGRMSDIFPLLLEIDDIIGCFVGESDNVTLPLVNAIATDLNMDDPAAFSAASAFANFQDSLIARGYACQRINSQILMSCAMDPDSLTTASAFMLLGQRFVIDSYITGNVVFDHILFNNQRVWRALPSTLDVLFALGNDAALQLLGEELEQYHYAQNLAALRYLVDSYDPEFWKGTLFNCWLNSIRALNPPSDRSGLPPFMKTAARWQEKMNTQLSSWAELRHDNLLYAKQSYSGGFICSYPESYVEPVPEFYDAVQAWSDEAAARVSALSGIPPALAAQVADYYAAVGSIVDTLGGIARKELAGTPLTDAERTFLRSMLHIQQMCGTDYDGWYRRLYFGSLTSFNDQNLVIADVHTSPFDESGVLVGWVLHSGTGPLNMAVVVTEIPGAGKTAFVGPVMSYYEHVTTNFKRLTDEEWKTMYAVAPSFRPSFVNIYLADSAGASRGEGPSLITGVENQQNIPVPRALTLNPNYPNPFNSSTIISFALPANRGPLKTQLLVYDVSGRLVRTLLNDEMSTGHYAVRWDGTNDAGGAVASGVYFYHLIAGSQRAVGKMSLVK